MSQAAHAYARTARTGLSPRQLEAAVLNRCASDLLRAIDGDGEPRQLLAALDRNREAWALFARAAGAPDSPLPEEQRNAILRMAAFTLQQTLDIGRKIANAPGATPGPLVSPLVHLNRELAAGLESRG